MLVLLAPWVLKSLTSPMPSINKLYPEELDALFPSSTSAYLTGLPRVETHRSGVELSTKSTAAVDQLLDSTGESIRRIEVLRRQLALQASIAHELTMQEGWDSRFTREQVEQIRALAALRSVDT